MSTALTADAAGLKRWLMADALPLWWEHGADKAQGGFYELLSLSADPIPADRRARVQARQVYAFATGGRLGWTGPWREAVAHGLDFFLNNYRLENGLFRTLVHADGSPADDTVWLYDQAFALLALAEASRVITTRAADFQQMARTLIAALSDRKLAGGGFREASLQLPFQSNPHMHLLEAALAWRDLDDDPVWDLLVDEIVGLGLTKFIDRQGALHEFFAEDWSFEPSVDGRIVEPGHQFEWAWLLERWARLRDRADAHDAAVRLFEIGKQHGVDPRRGVAFDQLLDDFSVHQFGARLWPQTERIKAASILLETAKGSQKTLYSEELVKGIEGLNLYLDVPMPGLWHDKLTAEGAFVTEPAPASSFYHIVCAIAELDQR